MTEENTQEYDEPTVDNLPDEEGGEAEYTDPMEAREARLEERARQQGWKPFEEWDGDPDEWVGPETFIVRGEFFDKQRNLQKQLKEQQEVIRQQAEMARKLAEKESEDKVKELRSQKALAYENEDWDKVVEIDEQIKSAQDEAKQVSEQAVEPQGNTNPEFEEWVNRPENSWYKNNKALRAAADAMAVEYARNNPQADFQEVADVVTKQMAEEFPDKFNKRPKNTRVNEPSMNGNSAARKKASVNKLTEQQKKIGQKFVRQGAVKNLQEYAEQLAAIGEI